LWRVLKGVRRETQIKQLAAIEEVEYLASVQCVPRQSIRMPREDAGSLPVSDAPQHLVEYRTAWVLGTLRLLKFSNDVEVVPLGMPFQLLNLGLNRHGLTVFFLGRFATVDKITIHKFEFCG